MELLDGGVLRVRSDGKGGKRTLRIEGSRFIGRFLQHVLPQGFKRIRHFGLLSPARKGKRLAAARKAVAAPAPSPTALEAAGEFMKRVAKKDIEKCPRCGQGTLRVVATLSPQRAVVPEPMVPPATPASCRGPPP